MDTGAGTGEWLTYDQIAQARGTSRIGAIRWVQRQRLRRQPGNDGKVRVLVEGQVLRPVTHRSAPPGALTTVPTTDPTAVAALAEAVTALRARADHDRAELAHLRERLAEAEQAARIATDALNAARRADEARKARGRLRRAWDGWRGR